jgi:hypothetical protein
MKSFKLFSLILVMGVSVVIASVSPAFALDCKNGNYGSDECWTTVMVSPNETTPVNVGTVLKYDIADDSSDKGAFNVRVATTVDGYLVAGVAQSAIATGTRGNILVRGKGKILSWGAVASGDRLWPSFAGIAVSKASADVASAASHDKAIAFSLTTGTGTAINPTSNDAYIVVI